MKRTGIGRGSKPLQRTAPMSAGASPLQRSKPMARRADTAPARPPKTAPDRAEHRAQARAPKPRPARRHTGPTPATRALVDTRDGGSCVRCGAPASNRDHRRTRGSGGSHGDVSDTINGAAWLLTLCGMGNTSGCHQWKDDHRADALRDGYALPLNGALVDAELVPVLTKRGWARFLNDGTRIPCPPPPDNDARNAWTH